MNNCYQQWYNHHAGDRCTAQLTRPGQAHSAVSGRHSHVLVYICFLMATLLPCPPEGHPSIHQLASSGEEVSLPILRGLVSGFFFLTLVGKRHVAIFPIIPLILNLIVSSILLPNTPLSYRKIHPRNINTIYRRYLELTNNDHKRVTRLCTRYIPHLQDLKPQEMDHLGHTWSTV